MAGEARHHYFACDPKEEEVIALPQEVEEGYTLAEGLGDLI